MDKLFTVLKREYVERVRSKWFLIATIFGPLFFGGVMFVPAWLASRSQASVDVARIVILDATSSGLGQRVADDLNSGGTGDIARMSDESLTQVREIAVAQLPAAESLATRAVIAKERRGYLVLDSQTVAGTTVRYAGRNASAVSDMQRLERSVHDQLLAMRMVQAGVSPAQATQLTALDVDLESERITDTGRGGSGKVNLIFAVMVAMLLYASIFIYGQNVLRSVMEEKDTRVAEVVLSSIPARKLLAGKVLGVGAVGMTQMIIWAATGVLLFKIRAPLLTRMGVEVTNVSMPSISPLMAVTLILFFALGYTLYAALFAAVGAMVNSEQEAQQVQMPIILMLISSVIFLQPVLTSPDGTLAKVLSWFPTTAPIIMPLRMSIVPISAMEIVGTLVALTLACLLVVQLAARIYRVGLLMYGKRPTLRELGRWMRQAA